MDMTLLRKHPFYSLFLILVLVLLVGLIWTKYRQRTAIKPLKNPKIALLKIGGDLPKDALGNPTTISSISTPGYHNIFVVDRAGLVRLVNTENVKAPVYTFLDISDRVLADGEMGLLGLAFDPKFSDDGYFYVDYVDKGQNTIISRFSIDKEDSDGLGDKSSEKVLLKIPQPYTNHNGGQLAFGPDGYLYIGMGDGGSAGDPENRAQNLNTLLGKILRIDVKSDSYKIPANNPFVKSKDEKGEIWDYGLRNPWRFSFDSKTGDLWIADVGQGNFEEIDLESANSQGGKNFGWRCYEGLNSFNLASCLTRAHYTFPILQYDHSENRCSVTGGYVYRGKKYPALVGKYFYADYCSGQIYMAEKKNGKWDSQLVASTNYAISTFGQDSDGELYLADFNTGNIYSIRDIAN